MYKITLIIALMAIIGGCTPSQATSGETQTASPPSAEYAMPNPTPATTLNEAGAPPSLSDGPLLLVQTDFDAYRLIDLSQEMAYPFNPPGENENFNLNRNLSPTKRKMLFPVEGSTLYVMDFTTWEMRALDQIFTDSALFQPETTAEEALETMPELNTTFTDMLSAIEEAFTQSKQNLGWVQDDDTLLLVQTGSATSTNLYSYDLLTGVKTQLEDQAGLVQAFWLAPGGEKILVKKGYIFDPNVWQDDRFFVVNVAEQSTDQIPLPQGSEYPTLSWLSPKTIGITHQTQPSGGMGYSIIDGATMESTLILDGAFSQVYGVGDNLLVTTQDQPAETTTLTWLDIDGEVTQSQTVDRLCRIYTVKNETILLSCEAESLLLNGSSQPQSFGDPILLLSSAPDGASLILVTRTNEIFLFDAALENRQSLTLTGSPLEIRWLPDSSGFLYRTQGELHYYNFETRHSRLLFTSDFFGDYTNLNAVWIKTE